MNKVYTLKMLQLLNLKSNKNTKKPLLVLVYNGVTVGISKPIIRFFSINVIGRIFRWVKYSEYMEFILPVHAKPTIYMNSSYLAYFLKNGKIFYIFNSLKQHAPLLKFLLKIKKPSIFNKRGLLIYNRIQYRKKGKITSYITNK